MKLAERLRRLDDAVLSHFKPKPRLAAGGLVMGPGTIHVHFHPGEKIIGGEELARLVARETAKLRQRGYGI